MESNSKSMLIYQICNVSELLSNKLAMNFLYPPPISTLPCFQQIDKQCNVPSILVDVKLPDQCVKFIITEMYTEFLTDIPELLLRHEARLIRVHVHKLLSQILPHVVDLKVRYKQLQMQGNRKFTQQQSVSVNT